MTETVEDVWTRRRQVIIVVGGVLLTLLSLVGLFFCVFFAQLTTYGLYSWTEPQLDPNIWIWIVGAGLMAAVGPLMMSFGRHPRRWRIIAVAVGIAAMVILSLATWVRVWAGLA